MPPSPLHASIGAPPPSFGTAATVAPPELSLGTGGAAASAVVPPPPSFGTGGAAAAAVGAPEPSFGTGGAAAATLGPPSFASAAATVGPPLPSFGTGGAPAATVAPPPPSFGTAAFGTPPSVAAFEGALGSPAFGAAGLFAGGLRHSSLGCWKSPWRRHRTSIVDAALHEVLHSVWVGHYIYICSLR